MTNKRGKESPKGSPAVADKKRMKPTIMSPGENSATRSVGRAELGTSNDNVNDNIIRSGSVDSLPLDDDGSMCSDSNPNDATPNDSTNVDYLLPNISPTHAPHDNNALLAQIDLSGPMINDLMPSDARKLFLTSCDPRIKLSNMNPFQIRKALNSLDGPVQDIQFLKSGSLFILCSSQTQMTNLLKISQMTLNSANLAVKFSLALADQSVQGKIYAPNLKDCCPEEILADLKPYKAVKFEKLLKDPSKSHIPLFLITFLGSQCPPHIRVAFCQFKVDRYVPGTIKCTNCVQFGHTKKYCKSQPTCAKCSEKGHLALNCTSSSLACPHCKGAHAAFSHECPKSRDENQINMIKHTENLSYFEARTQFFSNPNRSHVSSRPQSHADPLFLRSPPRSPPPDSHHFPPLSTRIHAIRTQGPSNTPNSVISSQLDQSFDSTRFTPNQVSNSPYSIGHAPFGLSQKENRPITNSLNSSFPSLSQIAQSQRISSKTPKQKSTPEPQLSVETLQVILKEILKSIIPTIIKLSLCDSLTSKIETIKDLGSHFDLDSTVDSLLEELNPSSISTSQ